MLPIEMPKKIHVDGIDLNEIDHDRLKKYTKKYIPRKVLVIGNGFDLAHGLLTSYDDFLQIMKDPEGFLRYYLYDIGEPVSGYFKKENPWIKYLKCVTKANEESIREMVDILKKNPWAYYYANCNAEINGWIDFEREMIPVINMFNIVLPKSSRYSTFESRDYASFVIEDSRVIRIARLWPKYLKVISNYEIIVESDYSDEQYGVLINKLLNDLKADLNEFVRVFCLYLDSFVEHRQEIELLPLFENMKVSDIINFNYTFTAYYYHSSLRNATIHYVHGSTLNTDPEKMIFGVNKVDDDMEYRFKDFEKRYQRLCNNTKQSYKRIIEEGNYELIFFGHSLDITDKSILEPLIQDTKGCKIYCYTDESGNSDKNTKIKNLMLILGDEKAEDMMQNGKIEFV